MRRGDKGRFVANVTLADLSGLHAARCDFEERSRARHSSGLTDCPRCRPESYAVVAKHRAEVTA